MYIEMKTVELMNCLVEGKFTTKKDSKESYDKCPKIPYLNNATRWKKDEDVIKLDVRKIPHAVLEQIQIYAKARHERSEFNHVLQNISMFKKICDNPKEAKVKTLKALEQAVAEYINATCYRKMVATTNRDQKMIMYVATRVSYTPSNPATFTQAHVSLHMSYVHRGKVQDKTISWFNDDVVGVGGITVGALLERRGFFIVTEDIYGEYVKSMIKFKEYTGQIGEQFTTDGMVEASSRYSSSWKSTSEEGSVTKLVCDEEENEVSSAGITSGLFWAKNIYTESEDEVPDDEVPDLEVPVHPYIKFFDLQNHYNVYAHVDVIKPYEYDKSVYDKLILPQDIKNLIDVMVGGTADIMEDIIQGKSGGIIVMASGAPGIGKTLTAEVYSEFAERPLYVVQSSQLGVSINDLEEKLKKVLQRAVKWKAILLIDEADVYIHERGDDLVQNAVVGVFLRVLEYYRGILFMTSNRGTIVDDAIMSRCTAHIRYPMPSAEDLIKIWGILAKQYKADITEEVIKQLVEHFPNISGRDVKTMLKLANMLSKRSKKPIDLELVKYVSGFHDISYSKEVEKLGEEKETKHKHHSVHY